MCAVTEQEKRKSCDFLPLAAMSRFALCESRYINFHFYRGSKATACFLLC